MKQIYVHFEDNEFEDLKILKKKRSWHDFIMLLTRKDNMTALVDKEEILDIEETPEGTDFWEMLKYLKENNIDTNGMARENVLKLYQENINK
ncbi:hypothetical protein LCGC14_1204450 [marine sediment metagenome]|uniref:Uncharacterized protein n=1 Tax=marine sediment metagenome TaxID=412755 RepID=A0A0F9PKQ8_9ZZZZ